MKLLTTMMATVLVAASSSCTTPAVTAAGSADGAQASQAPAPSPMPAPGNQRPLISGEGPLSALPKACAYRMNGDYADRVPVTTGPDGSIASYPAVSDIHPGARPVALAGGWWLDRRGISSRSMFTRYTYSEYAALKQTPTPQQLKEAILPGARVVETVQLPFTLQQALADTAAVNSWLRDNARPLGPHRL